MNCPICGDETIVKKEHLSGRGTEETVMCRNCGWTEFDSVPDDDLDSEESSDASSTEEVKRRAVG